MTCKFLAHLPLIVVIKTRMSSQKVYIIRTQCSIRVIVIFFGRPAPTFVVLSCPSVYVNPALNCSHQRAHCRTDFHREIFMEGAPLFPVEGALPLPPPVRPRQHVPPASPHLASPAQNRSKPTLCVSPKIASDWSTWLRKCVLQVFDQVGLKDNHGG